MKKRTLNLVGAALSLAAASAIAHEGHSPLGTLNHELEHGLWLVAALVLAAGAIGYRWLRKP